MVVGQKILVFSMNAWEDSAFEIGKIVSIRKERMRTIYYTDINGTEYPITTYDDSSYFVLGQSFTISVITFSKITLWILIVLILILMLISGA